MKRKLLLLFIASVACINLFCQNENQNLFYSDTSFVETLTRGTGDYAPYGSSFTPHGTFRVLIPNPKKLGNLN